MATLSITTTGPEDARIFAAFGKQLGLGRDATGPEVKAAIIRYVKDTVRNTETQAAIAVVSVPADVAPT